MDAPSVAVSNDGKKTVVAWMDMRSDGRNRDVQWTLGIRGKFAPETTVHDAKQGVQGHPSVTFDASGTAWCAWEDGRAGGNGIRIYAIHSKKPVNFQVSSDTEGKAGFPVLAAGKAGVAVVYEAGTRVSFRKLSTR